MIVIALLLLCYMSIHKFLIVKYYAQTRIISIINKFKFTNMIRNVVLHTYLQPQGIPGKNIYHFTMVKYMKDKGTTVQDNFMMTPGDSNLHNTNNI